MNPAVSLRAQQPWFVAGEPFTRNGFEAFVKPAAKSAAACYRFERSVTRSGGGLLRCQSHPSDLNTRRTRRRNYGRPCHHRPALDFTKMKQVSVLCVLR